MSTSNKSETVRVIVRCRPMNQREIDLNCQTIISMNTETNQVMLQNIEQKNEPPKQFTFDAVYPVDSITEKLYSDSVFPLVESILEGYNATVFAYGQTGCGKSFTMQGINIPGSPQRGVIPRSFEHIFEASSVTADTKYLIRASYLEIYNESIRDLLGKDVKAALDLKEYPDKGVHVQDLTWHQCTSVVDCERLMDKGNKSRATGATLMNKDSSRSHSIFTIVVEMCNRSEIDGKDHIRAGKLNLVDLAGSERQSKTHAEGERLREATRINLSLSALGNVISALVDGHSKHIPYRDSKLTRMLQDSLGGNTRTLMVAAISPAHDNYEETLSTLRYANRAKNIKNKPHINEDPRDAQMKLLQEEIDRLHQELLNNQSLTLNKPMPKKVNLDDELEKEKQRLQAEFEHEALELRRQCEEERLSKEDLQRKYDDLREQYDTEIETLSNSKQSNGGNTRTRTKKKTNANKQKRGEQYLNDEDATLLSTDPMNPEDKLQRLKELENKFIGGEDANNEERKKKRRKKLNEMRENLQQQERVHKTIDANGDDVLMRVFDNVQEELNFTSKKLEQTQTENKRLKKDNDDLQSEFERDREEFLETIRVQEQQLLLYRAILDKMSGTMERKCNYFNIDKIIEQSRYDEENKKYIVPDPITEEVQFPQVGNIPTMKGRSLQNDIIVTSKTSELLTNGNEQDPIVLFQSGNAYNNRLLTMPADEINRRYANNINTASPQFEATRNKRQEQLLNQNIKRNISQQNTKDLDYMNRRLNPFEAPRRLIQKYGSFSEKQ